jgi:hypothetical protein
VEVVRLVHWLGAEIEELCVVKGEVAEGQVPPRAVEPMEEGKEVEESKTVSFQIPT